MGSFAYYCFGVVGIMSYSKYRVFRVMLLALYYWIANSRTVYFFMVHLKGGEYAREFREKRRTLGSKIIR